MVNRHISGGGGGSILSLVFFYKLSINILCLLISCNFFLSFGTTDQFKGINDEGMLMYQRPFMRGKLYIHFTVDFPDTLTPELCKNLEAVLPPRPKTQASNMELDECEETTLHDVIIEEEMRRKKQQQAQEAYDEDDDDMHGGAQRVQCAQQ